MLVDIRAKGKWVHVGLNACLDDVAPVTARDLARMLIAAADEAESVPRFTDEDLEAIRVAIEEQRARSEIDGTSLEDQLRALRKPRES